MRGSFYAYAQSTRALRGGRGGMRKRPTFLSMNWARDHYCAELLTLINYQRWFLAPWTMKHSACFVRS